MTEVCHRGVFRIGAIQQAMKPKKASETCVECSVYFAMRTGLGYVSMIPIPV